jgi:hypothetical protein
MTSDDQSRKDTSVQSIEAPPVPPPVEPVAAVLRQRIRQQEILAELGVVSLGRIPLQELLDTSVRMAAEGLEAELCKVLDLSPRKIDCCCVPALAGSPDW